MALQLGDTAPDFTADSTAGKIRFHDWLDNSWGILFSHPADFTPVCTTELGELAKRKSEFDKRGVKLLGLSVDSVESHKKWAKDIKDVKGIELNYPILADPDRKVADLYGMMHPKSDPKMTVRSVFVIDPNKKIRLMMTYPPSSGRNVEEMLRVIDSLELADKEKLATPVDWKQGQDAIILPSVPDDEAKKLFPQGWKTVKPYLRFVRPHAR